ncbi:polysaccharide pyruvyl transferase family protein [Roseomonas sp. GC11]|uniref:polysaccharide pyruvyl transferase family protein n=1 Tax=Roseomonas sp. GC11 TaxID=2950546 RepID=UPI00210E521E|nr:polysaccharide pyruvyl transferase family protein [Roseomonas sp. GC11]MCQ4158994.1 polysaccharide pyruvyl transferase family protein [Roseomonas sp. GC11]
MSNTTEAPSLLTPPPPEPAYADLRREVAALKAVPLAWVRSSGKVPFNNFGDALSAVIVALLAGLPVEHRFFDARRVRMSAIGTIGQDQRNGTVHVWGTGFDRKRTLTKLTGRFEAQPDTTYILHALRGPISRRACLDAGLHAPAVYGDPGWLLPRLMPRGATLTGGGAGEGPGEGPLHELGLIPHISDLSEPSPQAGPAPGQARFAALEEVRFIPTYHAPSFAAFRAKLAEMLACRRILSGSFHGLILADAYGIPSAYLSASLPPGPHLLPLPEAAERIDHRVADFYMGSGRRHVLAIGLPPDRRPDWAAVMRSIDRHYEPHHFDARHLLEAFPLPLAVDPEAPRWVLPADFEQRLSW